jgi:hypothetical protein
MKQRGDRLPWHFAISTTELNHSIATYTFGPLVKTITRTAGQIQARVSYYDHKSKYFKTEAQLIAHMNRIARKGKK